MKSIAQINPLLTGDDGGKEFCQIYHRYKGMIERKAQYLTCSKQSVEDISQEIFLKLWVKWRQLVFLSEDKLEDYIYAMVRNEIINTYRKINRAKKYLKYAEAMQRYYWHDEALIKDGLKVYQKAVNQLPPRQKLVYLYHDQNIEPGEIATGLQRSERTINNQLTSAYKIVKRYINKELNLNICEEGRRCVWRLAA